ncbi:glycoside hydrolase family 5 protein [Ascoidea rubescens DSM 1968]|uniref:glucan 1,3-beta-glucosidase n=1 Tax=Ascoidea rubescens DSM 1968 TaxID=1344418 RepID=A0A1D2VGK6_9ASCO|nr:glycoside hydrolase family 5 protein [Ascoidea rubescens DSM 1968]ODV60765.1 glycoside hydrolase family 5 protein [Ascoidea rubescens DSM 1968]
MRLNSQTTMLLLVLCCLFFGALASKFDSEHSLSISRYYNGTIISSNSTNFTASHSLIRGVALGGWLLLEPYITPSLFDEEIFELIGNGSIPVDEYNYCLTLGKENATERLIAHWDTFYNESDFEDIENLGLNLVRIPLGYWAFKVLDDDPYVTGYQEAYLDKAIEWAEKYNLKVWIDLHGAPGGQNGFDNSGLRDHIDWLSSEKNINLTLQVLDYIFSKYSGSKYSETVIGIEILNEPMGSKLNLNTIRNFYYAAYNIKTKYNYQNHFVIHDAFKGIRYWDDYFPRNITQNVIIDRHLYHVFGSSLNYDVEEHIASVNQSTYYIVEESKNTIGVVGEWSAALTDCAFWLNGVDRGARYEGKYDNFEKIGSCKNIDNIDKWSDQKKMDTRRLVEAQLDYYEKTGGWIFWCYKTEETIEWDMSRLVEYELFPQPLTHRLYNSTFNYTSNSSAFSLHGSLNEKKYWGFTLLLLYSIVILF